MKTAYELPWKWVIGTPPRTQYARHLKSLNKDDRKKSLSSIIKVGSYPLKGYKDSESYKLAPLPSSW